MRKHISLFNAFVVAALLGSCADDDLGGNQVINPVQTGDEVLFGSSLSGNATDSRTVYGDRTDTGIPVYWKEEGDEIAIFCPQASQPADHLVHYLVKPDATDPSHSSTVAKFDPDEAGLQWGDYEEHRFYAFYPGTRVLGTEDDGRIKANIPVEQQVAGWRTAEANDPNAINGQKTYFGLPDMDLAYMYAYTSVNKSETDKNDPIPLAFHNLLTVLDITIQGPESGEPIKVTNINVDAVDPNVILTGDFHCYLRADETHEQGCCVPVESNTVRNRISISTYKDGDFIALAPGELLNIKAYLIPDDEHTIEKEQLQITVATLNGAAKTKKLTTANIVPHKINRVRLDKLEAGGTNYWMNNLDENIFMTELSIPGSHQSVGTKDETDGLWPWQTTYERYQNKSLQAQFTDGVRAFFFQVDKNGDVQASGESQGSLSGKLDELNACLTTAQNDPKGKKEFVFVSIGYKDIGRAIWEDPEKMYLDKVLSVINNKDYVYKPQIDNNTTLGDVKGKMVVMIDRKSESVSGNNPALFTTWQAAIEATPLPWGNTSNTPILYLYSQDLTSISNGHSGGQIGTLEEKKEKVKQVFDESINMYQNDDQHHYVYLNNLGGYYLSSSDYTKGGNTTRYATDVNNFAVEELQKRKDNASLGIIFMNFADKQTASGAQYKSDYLIQTVIDNNFKFALRKRGNAQ